MKITFIALIVLLFTAVEDIRKKDIPSYVVYICGAVSAFFTCYMVLIKTESVTTYLLSLIPGLVLLAIAFLTREGIGYGDGLIILSVGPMFGLYEVVFGLFVAFTLSSLFSITLLAIKKLKGGSRIPFIPFITLGLGVATFATI